MNSNISVYAPLMAPTVPPPRYNRMPPLPRKISQKERRKKARYRRSQGIKVR